MSWRTSWRTRAQEAAVSTDEQRAQREALLRSKASHPSLAHESALARFLSTEAHHAFKEAEGPKPGKQPETGHDWAGVGTTDHDSPRQRRPPG